MNTNALNRIVDIYGYLNDSDKAFIRDNYERIISYSIEPFDHDSNIVVFKGYYDVYLKDLDIIVRLYLG